MAKIPKQRGSGMFGGDGHRSNKGAFRASGGSVRPPTKGCLGVLVLVATLPVAVTAVATAIL